MTHLLTWLTAHHLFPMVYSNPTHHTYAMFHAHCSAHRFLTGWAEYGHRVVAYCYSK